MTAYIAHTNLLESADTVTASNEASGFEGANAYDRRTSTWWKPGVLNSPASETLTANFSSSQTVDYFGVIGHNLGTEGCTIALQYSTASPQSWTTLFTITPTTDKFIFRYDSTGASAADWRVVITNATASALLSIAAFGQATALPEGIKAPFRPVNHNRKNKYLNETTDGGQFVGRSIIAEGREVTINQRDVDKSWIDSNYETLIDGIETSPFFFSWNYENYINDAAYVWVNGSISHPSRDALYSQFSIPCRGLIE